MRIIIVGAGEVGLYLAGVLNTENHDLTVIDTNPEKTQQIAELHDVKVLEGNGANAAVLEQAEVGQADMLLALTDKDEINMLAAYFGKQLGAKHTVARIASDDAITGHPAFYRRALDVDLVISPARLAAAEATSAIHAGGGAGIAEFGFGRVHLRPFLVRADSPYTKKPIHALRLPGALIVAILRGAEVIIPGGDDQIEPGDRIFVICKTDAMQHLQRGVGEETGKVKKIIIVGGSTVGVHIAHHFDSPRFQVKLFEDDRKLAWHLAEELRHVHVIESDGADIEVLEEEYLEAAHAFVAATEEDEKNLLACVLAHDHGVTRTIAVVDKPQFAVLGKKLGITATLAPRILAANQVLTFMRGGNVNRVSLIAEGKGEVIEFQARDHTRLVGRPLRDLKLPRGIIVGAIVRGKKAVIPSGSDEIEPGDIVVLFTTQEHLETVNSWIQIKEPADASNAHPT